MKLRNFLYINSKLLDDYISAIDGYVYEEETQKLNEINQKAANAKANVLGIGGDGKYEKQSSEEVERKVRISEAAKFDKLLGMETLVADAGYRTPAIAKLLIDDGIQPLFTYKRPMTKKGFFRKYEYVYDEYYDCYLCPNNQVLKYSTTNRDGYREYKSCGAVCAACPYLSRCTESKSHVKVVTRHIWEEYMEKCEDIRHTTGMKQLYGLRKETIERIFGTAKENHGFRYTQMYGKARMEMKVGLTYLCMNLKKLAKMKQKLGVLDECFTTFAENFVNFIEGQRKTVLRLFPPQEVHV